MTDLTIPIGMLPYTQRYISARRVLLNNPGIDTIIGHSLGGAIAHALADNVQVRRVRSYGSPTIFTHPKVMNFRHDYDPISIVNRLGGSVAVQNKYWSNPHTYAGFKTYYN